VVAVCRDPRKWCVEGRPAISLKSTELFSNRNNDERLSGERFAPSNVINIRQRFLGKKKFSHEKL